MTDLLERRPTKSRLEPTAPGCTARMHGTDSAYRRAGCRCPDAVTDNRRHNERWNTQRRVTRQRDPGKAGRPPSAEPPWFRWRGPHTRVDALTVDHLVAGYRLVGTPTLRERQVAVWRLMRTRRMDSQQIAAWLDVSQRMVQHYQNARHNLRAQRTHRRHADAVWRAWHKHGQRW